jgi:hypothetical protein
VYVVRDGRRYPKHHWAFMGEIVTLQITSQIVAMTVQDRTWKRVTCMVGMHFQEVDTTQFQVGWTLFVRYAEARRRGDRLGDTTDVLFIDDARLVTTLPAPLSDVLYYDSELAAREHMTIADAANIECANCQEKAASKRCADCKVKDYCSRECQVAHWKEHRAACRIWAALRDIHADVGEEVHGEVPRSYSVQELSSAPLESRMQTEQLPFTKNAWVRSFRHGVHAQE